MPPADSSVRVLVIGDVMTDVIVRPEGPIVIGSDRRAKIALHPGGAGCNQAAWLARLGVPVGLVGKVNRRDLADQSLALREEGVVPHLAADDDRGTGMLINIVSNDGERSFLTDRGANETLRREDMPDHLLDGLSMLHVSGYALFAPGPRAAVMDYMRLARARGVAVTIDPGSVGFLEEVGSDHFLDWSQAASVIFPNADEARCLTRESDPVLQRAILAERFSIVVIKRGADGAEAASDGHLWEAKARTVDAVDTTGAGDAFLAGFIAAKIDGRPIDECLARAVEAGTKATLAVGGRPLSPNREEPQG